MNTSPPRRVLLLPILFYPEPWNGIMEHLRLLAALADPARYAFTLAVRPGDGPQTATLAERAGVPVIAAPDVLSMASVRRLCLEARADLVHVHASSTGGLARVLSGVALARSPAVVTYHLVQEEPQPLKSRLINGAVHRIAVRRIVAVSRGVADSLASQAGLGRESISVIANAIEPWAGDIAEGGAGLSGVVRIGYFGRLSAEKSVADLIEAVVLARRNAPVELHVFGEGYERPSLEQLVLAHDASGWIRFNGFVATPRNEMRTMDIVALPSRLEGLPTVVVEAMEAGLPVVATDIAGTRELVEDDVTGLLTPVGDPPALASALVRLAGDAHLRARMGANGRARYERLYRAESMVARVTAVYASV